MPMTNPGKFDSNGAWDGFRGEIWQEEINVRDFIQKNYTPYDGDETFLEGATESTEKLWNRVQELQKQERAKGGVLECETDVVSGLTAYGPGYISEELKDLEQIVGLQTDKPLKRAFMPYGGIKMATKAAETYGYEINPELKKKPEYLLDKLKECNIESRRVWKPLHRQPLYENCRMYSKIFKDCYIYMSDYCFLTGLCLPSDTRMSLADVNFVADRIIEILEA